MVETSRNRVDQFKRTMPLITDLKNHAMRPRHWEKIQVNDLITQVYDNVRNISNWLGVLKYTYTQLTAVLKCILFTSSEMYLYQF